MKLAAKYMVCQTLRRVDTEVARSCAQHLPMVSLPYSKIRQGRARARLEGPSRREPPKEGGAARPRGRLKDFEEKEYQADTSHQKKVAAAAKAAEDARGELNERRLAQERAEAQRRKAQWAKVREMQTELEEKEEQRDRFHRRLNSALEKLERREQRAAKGHDIFSDLGDGFKRMTSGADRLLKSVGL